jgi:NDP-sugar pyrophosphorylase family protein
LDHRIFNYSLVPISETEYGLPQTLVKMAKDYPVTIERATFWMPVNTIKDLKQANKYLKKIYL